MKKLLTLILSLTLCVGVCSFTGCGSLESQKEDITANGSIEIEQESGDGIGIITLASQSVVTETGNYLEKTLQATLVGPETEKKPLDLVWGVQWYDSQSGDLSEILTVTPDSSDSSICQVRLYGPLWSTALITVECKNNKVMASCTVEYSSDMKDIGFALNANRFYDESINDYVYELVQGNVYTANFFGLDFFGCEMLGDFDVSMETFGDINFKSSGLFVVHPKNPYSLDNFINPDYVYTGSYDIDKDLPDDITAYTEYLNYSQSDSTTSMNINAVTGLNNLKVYLTTSNDAYWNNLCTYNSAESFVPYVKYTVTCGDFSTTFNVRVVSNVNLSLNNSSIIFS